MTKTKYKDIILAQLQQLGTYESTYDNVIESLAAILEQRDKTMKEFKAAGGKSIIEYTNKGGATNTVKNPLLVMWDDQNKTALAYWKELGLTPSSYKKITGEAPKKSEKKGLVNILAETEG